MKTLCERNLAECLSLKRNLLYLSALNQTVMIFTDP